MNRKTKVFIMVLVLIFVFFAYKIVEYNKIYLLPEIISDYIDDNKFTRIMIFAPNYSTDKKMTDDIYSTKDEELIFEIYNYLSSLELKKNFADFDYFDDITIYAANDKNDSITIYLQNGTNNIYISIRSDGKKLNKFKQYRIVSESYNSEEINSFIKKMTLVLSP